MNTVFGTQILVVLRLCDLFQMWMRGVVFHAVQTVWFVPMILPTASTVQTTLTFSIPPVSLPANFPSSVMKMAGLVEVHLNF